jgi:eukaryotic-like serine/threonine-protein kinase
LSEMQKPRGTPPAHWGLPAANSPIGSLMESKYLAKRQEARGLAPNLIDPPVTHDYAGQQPKLLGRGRAGRREGPSDGSAVSTHDWPTVEELLHQAMALAPEQRANFLNAACGSDAELRAELNSLLMVGDDLSDEFLNSPLRAVLDRGISETDLGSAMAPGQIFAQRFELIRKLGEGGMGQVWLAEQVSPVRRQVALKLIKAGMYDEAVVQRFQSERQSLAMMDHPAIAKVFDAGTTSQGQPYLVMEFVPGLPITDYCDEHKLDIKDRLDLFIHACEGVQHAHQKAIIHRDLKPSNILVVEVDGKPVPRIIDFGLAKTTAPQVSDESLFTQLGQFIGTPGYMSPEQVSPSARDIDTRTDVYTLGVVLYVLLTGLQPFETKRREKPSLEEWLRQLREEEPPNPSTKVSADKDTSSATADARRTEPKQLISQLRGDLDWITMKALERNRERRYATPIELAADLRRYLNDEPVVARPASPGYRLRKYTRRHRVAVGVGAGLLTVLAGFSVLQSMHLRETTRQRDYATQEKDRANQERDRANQERDRATRITNFMTGMFEVPDPSEARGNSVTAREILDKASNEIGKGLAQDLEVQSQMMQVMASTYTNLGLYPRAYELAKRALDARSALRGPDDRKTLESMVLLGWILHFEGHDPEAEQLERQTLTTERRVLGTEDSLTLETMIKLGGLLVHQGHFDQEEKLEREVIEATTRSLGPDSTLTLQATNRLGEALLYQARYIQAEQVFRRLLEIDLRVWGPDHPETLVARDNLAHALYAEGRFTEAEPLYRDVLANSQRVLGPDHPVTNTVMNNLGNLLVATNHFDEAERLYRDVLAIRLRTLGSEHPGTLDDQERLAYLLFKEDRLHEAEIMQRETFAIQRRVLGSEQADTLWTETRLVKTLLKERRFNDAERIARQILDVQLRVLGPQNPYTLATVTQLGLSLAHTHRYAEAKARFRELIDKVGDTSERFDIWYDFACVAGVANQAVDAIKFLREAVTRGYTDADGLMADSDLTSLHASPEFQRLVAELKHTQPTEQPK